MQKFSSARLSDELVFQHRSRKLRALSTVISRFKVSLAISVLISAAATLFED